MEENNGKLRHGFVTFWLWASTALNIIGALSFLGRMHNFPRVGGFILLLYVIVAVSNILILKWKLVGFYIIAVSLIALPFLLILHRDLELRPIPAIMMSIVFFLLYFGILNIRKNGVSTWRLLNQNIGLKKRFAWFMIVFGAFFIIPTIASFPIKNFYGRTVILFAPENILRLGHSTGWVLGNHTFETEYGKIRLGHFSEIVTFHGSIFIERRTFEAGRAFHNLVIEGIEMPENIMVNFGPRQINWLDAHNQEMMVSGVPVTTSRIHINPSRSDADILFFDGARFVNEHIILADSTEINVRSSSLSIYKADRRWVLENPPSWASRLYVRLPHETEFIRYRSITIGQNWGDFIEGVVHED